MCACVYKRNERACARLVATYSHVKEFFTSNKRMQLCTCCIKNKYSAEKYDGIFNPHLAEGLLVAGWFHVLHDVSGAAEQVRQTRQPPDQ